MRLISHFSLTRQSALHSTNAYLFSWKFWYFLWVQNHSVYKYFTRKALVLVFGFGSKGYLLHSVRDGTALTTNLLAYNSLASSSSAAASWLPSPGYRRQWTRRTKFDLAWKSFRSRSGFVLASRGLCFGRFVASCSASSIGAGRVEDGSADWQLLLTQAEWVAAVTYLAHLP